MTDEAVGQLPNSLSSADADVYLTPLMISLLIDGSEEYTGFWDAKLEARSSEGRAGVNSADWAIAATALRSLAESGLVDFYVSYSSGVSDLELVERSGWPRLFAEESPWETPTYGSKPPIYYFLATYKGLDLPHANNWWHQ